MASQRILKSLTRHATTLKRNERNLTEAEICAPDAFVCHGECGGVCDRPWKCGTTTCSRHGESLVQERVVFWCAQCQKTSEGPALCDCKASPQQHREGHVQCASCKESDPMQCCTKCPVVLDVSQLPSLVPAVLCGSKLAMPFARDDFVAVVPASTREVEWHSRFIHYKDVNLKIANGQSDPSGDTLPINECVCLPGQSLRLEFGWKSRFAMSQSVYCPGCIVQMYVGIGNVFSHGFISGVGSGKGAFESICEAPQEPGVYYVTQAISLQYNYVKVSHSMGPELAIAVLRVLPASEWTPLVNSLLSEQSRDVISVVDSLATANSSLFKRLPTVLLHIVYAFSMDYE